MAFSIALTFLPLRFAFAGAVTTLAPVTEADGRLGLCDVLPGSPPGSGSVSWAQLAYNAGARIDRWEVRWDRVEPRAGAWDFSAPDAAIQSAESAGLQVEGILIGTPGWAAATGQLPGNGLPKGLFLPYTDPRNLWADYVRQTVSHYAQQVRYWEVWNEPDLRYFWTGTPRNYFRLLKVAYLVIQSAAPGAQVIMAGMVVPDLAFLSGVLDAANADPGSQANHGYFNVAAWHSYGPAGLLYTNIQHFKALLASKGFGAVPLWVTEDGFPANNPNGEPRQAAYVLQTVAYAFAAGASRLLIYRASDSAEPKTWGLMTPAGSPRLGYVAFQVAARYLSNVQAVTYEPTPDLDRFVFYEPQQRVTLLWAHGTADQDASLYAGQESGELVDWMGQQSSIAAAKGEFRFTVLGASFNAGVDPSGSVVGGPPVMLIEDNTAPANLTSQIYLAPVPGLRRRLVVLNQGGTVTSVEVAAAADSKNRVVLQIPAHSMRTVDLDLLAGSGYREMYSLSSASAVTAEAVSNRGIVQGSQPALSWYMAAAPPTVTIANTAGDPVTAKIAVFGPKGAVRARGTFQLQPFLRQDLSLPVSSGAGPLSLSVQATGPVVVAGAKGAVTNPVSQPQNTWYAVRPNAAPISVFNPDAHKPAQVDVQFVGSAVKSEQLQVGPHHAFVLPSGDAAAVVIRADEGVTAGYTRHTASAGALAMQPSSQAAVEAAGNVTQVALFNPSTKTAHVTLSIVGEGSASRIAGTLAPSQVVALRVRTAVSPARGVEVNSDVPVVATPAS